MDVPICQDSSSTNPSEPKWMKGNYVLRVTVTPTDPAKIYHHRRDNRDNFTFTFLPNVLPLPQHPKKRDKPYSPT